MPLNRYKILLILCFFAFATPSLFSQRVGFVNSETIRKKFPDAEQAEQRIQTIVDEWKREIKSMQEQIDKLEYDIKKNRLIWSDEELQKNETDLAKLKKSKTDYATDKFQPGGEFDKTVKAIQTPIEIKIYEAIKNKTDLEDFGKTIEKTTDSK